MAAKRELEIVIAPDGTTSVNVTGMPGKQCLRIKEIVERTVGPLQSQRFTAEYYEPESSTRISLEQR